eukprot:2735247-Amphidinium_carterae.2
MVVSLLSMSLSRRSIHDILQFALVGESLCCCFSKCACNIVDTPGSGSVCAGAMRANALMAV